MKLTEAQREMLKLVGSQHTIRSGLKGHLVGDGWRRLDRLVSLGLVRRFSFGAHQITDAGRAALVGSAKPREEA
jgi:hypothetical protein